MCTSDFYKNVIAVTNRSLCERPFPEHIERVCNCHPKAIILREKDLPEEEYLLLAEKILNICREYDVPCMLHTYINTARKLEHPFIHLPLFLLKKYQGKLENFREIGCSIHSVEDASPYIISFSLRPYRSEILLHFLEKREIFVSSGSACSKGKNSGVPVLFGATDAEADSILRVSLSAETPNTALDALVSSLQEATKTLLY